jgi:DNA-binding transcriptional regulator YiaG
MESGLTSDTQIERLLISLLEHMKQGISSLSESVEKSLRKRRLQHDPSVHLQVKIPCWDRLSPEKLKDPEEVGEELDRLFKNTPDFSFFHIATKESARIKRGRYTKRALSKSTKDTLSHSLNNHQFKVAESEINKPFTFRPFTCDGSNDGSLPFWTDFTLEPLIIDIEEKEIYYPITLGIISHSQITLYDFEKRTISLKPIVEWKADTFKDVWISLEKTIQDVIDSLKDGIDPNLIEEHCSVTYDLPDAPTLVIAHFGPIYERLQEWIQPELYLSIIASLAHRLVSPLMSVMGRVPIPRKALTYGDRAAMTFVRGIGRKLAGQTKDDDLNILGPVAQKAALDGFWRYLEQYFDKYGSSKGSGFRWEKLDSDDGNVELVLYGLSKQKAEELFKEAVNAIKDETDGPGIEVHCRPHFKNRSKMVDGKKNLAFSIFMKPKGGRAKNCLAESPCTFKSPSSPGYQALIRKYPTTGLSADGWLWISRDDSNQLGFRIESQNQTTATRIQNLNTSNCQDVLFYVFEAFYRQMDDWLRCEVVLKDGKRISTEPRQIIRIDPEKMDLRLGLRKGRDKNWRAKLFDQLNTLAVLEMAVKGKEAREKHVKDRLLTRAIDGLQCGNSDSGLLDKLRKEGAIPSDSFFIELSGDFIGKYFPRASRDDDSVQWRWGEDASKPYYYHSPRLLSVRNLENWPQRRKLLSELLLQEISPNYADRKNSKNKTTLNEVGSTGKLLKIDGRDYICCNGSKDYGYRTREWMKRAHYETEGNKARIGFKTFVHDLDALTDSLDLKVELVSVDKWNQEAVKTLKNSNNRKRRKRALDFVLKCYLPADLEKQLRQKLRAKGIEAVDRRELAFASEEPVIAEEKIPAFSSIDLTNARRDAGLSQGKLAEKVGVSQPHISRWENGRPIPDKHVTTLFDILGAYLEN